MAELIQERSGTLTTLESNGASTLDGAFTQADDAGIDYSNSGAGYYIAANQYDPVGRFVLSLTLGSAPGANAAIALHLRALDVDSTSDTPAPSANYDVPVGFFNVPNATGTHNLECFAPQSYKYDAYVSPDGFTLPTGWTLKVAPQKEKSV